MVYIRTCQLRSHAPPSLLLLAVWKSERGPGIIYHVSNVEGREDIIDYRRIVDELTHTVAQLTIHVGVLIGRSLLWQQVQLFVHDKSTYDISHMIKLYQVLPFPFQFLVHMHVREPWDETKNMPQKHDNYVLIQTNTNSLITDEMGTMTQTCDFQWQIVLTPAIIRGIWLH